MIEQAYTQAAQQGLAVWCEDEAGPFQAVPHPGVSWQPQAHPTTQPHEYIRGGTAKILTLFHPASGQVWSCFEKDTAGEWAGAVEAGIGVLGLRGQHHHPGGPHVAPPDPVP